MLFKHLKTSLSARALCAQNSTEHRTLVLNWALSHLFLFACLNCDLYLFVQVQEDAKESSICCCGPLHAHQTQSASNHLSFFRMSCV